MPSRSYDAVDTFNWRLTSKDGPELSGYDVAYDNPEWVKEDRVHWPRQSTPEIFADDFINHNVELVTAALKQSRSRKCPVCFSTTVSVPVIEKKFRAFVGAWIKCWPDLLAQASEALPEKLRSSPQEPVVGLLFLGFESNWLSSLFSSDYARIAERCNELKHLESETAASGAVDFSFLPPLAPITWDDATVWLSLPDVDRAEFYVRARSAVDRMFQRSQASVSMQKFAERILMPGG